MTGAQTHSSLCGPKRSARLTGPGTEESGSDKPCVCVCVFWYVMRERETERQRSAVYCVCVSACVLECADVTGRRGESQRLQRASAISEVFRVRVVT